MKHILLWVVTKNIKLKKIENSFSFPPLMTPQRLHMQGFSVLPGLLPACRLWGQFLPGLKDMEKILDSVCGSRPSDRLNKVISELNRKNTEDVSAGILKLASVSAGRQSPGNLTPAAPQREEEEESHDHVGFGLFDLSSALLRI